jgi:hypothetical protein
MGLKYGRCPILSICYFTIAVDSMGYRPYITPISHKEGFGPIWLNRESQTMEREMHFPDAPEKIKAAHDAGILKSGQWGDGTHAVCMMSALVPGAATIDDCVTAGWPKWLSDLNVHLFDVDVGADDEDYARYQFSLAVATAVSVPRDYDKARDIFLIRRIGGKDVEDARRTASLVGKKCRAEYFAALERDGADAVDAAEAAAAEAAVEAGEAAVEAGARNDELIEVYAYAYNAACSDAYADARDDLITALHSA